MNFNLIWSNYSDAGFIFILKLTNFKKPSVILKDSVYVISIKLHSIHSGAVKLFEQFWGRCHRFFQLKGLLKEKWKWL